MNIPPSAVICVVTDRPALAHQTLHRLDAQEADFHLFIALNTVNLHLAQELEHRATIDMRHPCTVIRLSAQRINIGVPRNCGTWHALNHADEFKVLCWIDDDIRLESPLDLLLFRAGKQNGIAYVDVGGTPKQNYAGALGLRTGLMACNVVTLERIGWFSERIARSVDLEFGSRAQKYDLPIVPVEGVEARHSGAGTPTIPSIYTRMLHTSKPTMKHTIPKSMWTNLELHEVLIADRIGWMPRTGATSTARLKSA